MAWDKRAGSHYTISQFLKAFRDAPHRYDQARSFVDGLCDHVLVRFAVASAEDLQTDWTAGLVSEGGGYNFVRAASFVGNLIKLGLLGRELVRRHLPKPLTAHHYSKNDKNTAKLAVRANAIYSLLTGSGNTLLQGLLEPEDVQVCLEKMEARIPLGEILGLYAFSVENLNVQ